MATTKHLCECTDGGCPCCHGECEAVGVATLYRCDMADETGTLFCEGCSADALEAGVFTSEQDDTCPDCGEEYDTDCMGQQRCPTCDGPCPHCNDGGM